MSKKCIIWVRCSTERQEIESQKKETIEYAKSLKFDEFIIVGQLGASAYKVNKLYLGMVEKMKQLILSDKSIEAVVCWHLNRIARNEAVAIDIKDFLIENKIQLYVREPGIKLLKDDGTVDDGAELVYNIFSTMSKQQISELRMKIKRAKKRDKALHKFIGGATLAFGYKVDENNMVVPDEKSAEIVNTIYNLYGTGEYSYTTLVKEINERYGTNWGWYYMKNILDTTRYYDETKYPAIISKLQYEKATQQRKNSTSRPAQSKHFHFANRLIKCPICGRGYTGNIRDYRCTKVLEHKDRATTISIPNLDGILWTIAQHLESQKLLKASAKDEYIQNKAVLEAKIDGVGQSLTRLEKKAERGKKLAIEGLIEVEEYKAILEECEAAGAEIHLKVDNWKSQIADLDRLINEDTIGLKRILEISDHITELDELEMRNIVRRWIRRITFDDKSIFTIETLIRTYRCRYNRYGYESRWYTTSGNALVTRPYLRDKDGARFGKNRCTVKDLPITLAWLGGSEIV